MNRRSNKVKTNGKRDYKYKRMFEVEGRANKTPEELLLGIRDKIQGVLKR